MSVKLTGSLCFIEASVKCVSCLCGTGSGLSQIEVNMVKLTQGPWLCVVGY